MDEKIVNDFTSRFSVAFVDDRSVLAKVQQPLGHYATQALQMDDATFDRISKAAEEFEYEMHVFFSARDPSSAGVAQEALNRLYDALGELPAFDLMVSNEAPPVLRDMRMNPDVVDEIVTAGTTQNKIFWDWMQKLKELPKRVRNFALDTDYMLEFFFWGMGSRQPTDYASSYLAFQNRVYETVYGDEDEDEVDFAKQFQFSFPVQVSYTPLYTGKGTMLAEEIFFEDLVSFLYIDLYKGMMAGNLPRRCDNCGKYFLTIGAYNTCYCNEIAPGETERTCRMVGAHRKEKAKSNSQPILKEYSRVYNRIKARKRKGKITVEEWNKQVAYIQEIKEAALRGKYTDEQVKKIFDKI